MPYLSAATHAAIINDPAYISTAWMTAENNFRRDIGPVFSGRPADLVAAAFCSIVAYDLKPYGQSNAVQLRDLLDSPAIDCDNYCFLTWHLFRLLRPTTAVEMAMVGWDKGAVGNHAQILATIGDTSAWLLDPTIGLIVAGATFDRICRGEPLTYMTQPAGTRDLAYSRKIQTAVSTGLYRPSDLMYYFKPVQKYIDGAPRKYWATPRA
jgi:hypothetical protein